METTGASEPAISGLVEDLDVLAALRSRTAVRDRHLTHLLDLLAAADRADIDRRYIAMQHLIARGLDAMTDPAHQQAARALVDFGPGRWRPIKQRGAEAAAAFGLGWDGYRRKRETTGVSLREETLAELAQALLVVRTLTQPAEPAEPAASPEAPPPPADREATVSVQIGPPTPVDAESSPHGPEHPGRSGRSKRLLAIVVVVVVVVVVAVAALATAWGMRSIDRSPDRFTAAGQSATCGNLQSTVGDLAPGADASLERWALPFRRAASKLETSASRCAAPIEIEAGQIFERISDGGSGVGALLAAPDGGTAHVVALDPLEWVEYQKHQFDATDPTDRLGAPIRRADRRGGLRVVEFTTGVTVQEVADGSPYAVVQRNWEFWRSLGGLDGRAGRPLSQAHEVSEVGRVQDFTEGRIVTDFSTGTARWAPATPADRRLPADYRGAILVGSNADAWFVDLDGRRHWLPTVTDYECAQQGHDAPPITEVTPIAIAELPLGKAFRCR